MTLSSHRGQFLADSLITRALLLLLLSVPFSALVILLVGDQGLAPILVGFATLLAALASPWFYAGEARPWRLVFFSTAPAVIGSLVACGVLVVSRDVIAYGGTQLLAAAAAVVVQSVDILKRHRGYSFRFAPHRIGLRLRDGLPAVLTAIMAALYVNAPLIAVTAIAPSVAPGYAMADRLFRYTKAFLAPFSQYAQGYVPAGAPAERKSRATRALIGSSIAGAIAAITFAVLVPPVGSLLSSGEISVSYLVSGLLALAVLAVSISSVSGLSVLASIGGSRYIAVSTFVGACLGIPAAICLTLLAGAVGAATSMAVAEVVVVSIQLIVLPVMFRRWNEREQ
ncbi:MAG TPA: hypothetical protein DHW40_12370 [Microbacterium sp.]|nr:hypothetical protein [Microbacterium sp.]